MGMGMGMEMEMEKEKREGKGKGRNCTESFGPSSNLPESRDPGQSARVTWDRLHRPESIAEGKWTSIRRSMDRLWLFELCRLGL